MDFSNSSQQSCKMIYFLQGEIMCGGFTDGSLRLFSTSDGELLQEMVGHEDKVAAVAFDPRGR